METDDPITGPFLVDNMCGKLAVYLRMCGYDTKYAGDDSMASADTISRCVTAEDRTLITRKTTLADRTACACLLERRTIEEQLAERAGSGVPLAIPSTPRRCGRCNGTLEPVPETAQTAEYAPDPSSTAIWHCCHCQQCFWSGSHINRVRKLLSNVSA